MNFKKKQQAVMVIKRPDPADVLVDEKIYLSYSGLYSESTKISPVFYIRGFITVCCSFLQFLSLVMRIYFDRGDVGKMLETLYFLNTQTAYICKLFPFLYQRKKLFKFEQLLRSDVFNSHTKEQDHFLTEAIQFFRPLAKYYRNACFITVACFSIFPYWEGTVLAVPAWFPFDIEKNRYPIYSFQVISFFLSAYNSVTIDNIAVGLVSMGATQFEVLKDNLTNCKPYQEGEENGEDMNEIVKERLKKCIIHQQSVLSYIQEVQDMFSIGTFFQFCNSLLTICLTGIQFISVEMYSMKFFSLAMYLVCMTSQVALYCWFGHDILVKSGDIGQACYMSQWDEFNPEVRKILITIMERAKKPTCLTAAKIFPLTLGTFASIMRSAYSYYAVLRTMYAQY